MPNKHQPYVGDSAFAHKGGVHIHAVLKNPATYEHVIPGLVGNRQRMLVSDCGRSEWIAGEGRGLRNQIGQGRRQGAGTDQYFEGA